MHEYQTTEVDTLRRMVASLKHLIREEAPLNQILEEADKAKERGYSIKERLQYAPKIKRETLIAMVRRKLQCSVYEKCMQD